ncbi:hypothetical protein B0H14DRAFT_2494623 [Mycena olivaceomarginata]|nr:hypothetical protein B0H14DRAFT_2494623 [Mycena olivaceomarginata]
MGKSRYTMRLLCFALHTGLMLLHVLLLVIWTTRLEHRMIFPLELQTYISEVTKVTMTGFATIYLALVVFVTQKLAYQYNLEKYQTLTATHDNLLSWSGIGSALNSLYLQISLPASVTGTLSVFAYLMLVTVIHITTPALVSVQTFSLSTSSVVPTAGIPQWNQSNHEHILAFMEQTVDFLPWIHNLNDTLGLFNGSLYEVLQDDSLGSGSAEVSAIGLNVTCGYLAGTNTHILRGVAKLGNII